MSDAPVTLEELRSVDLFDDLDDAELAEWVPARAPLPRRPGRGDRRAGARSRGACSCCSRAKRRRCSIGRHPQRAGRAASTAPTWMGAIAVLTGGRLGARMQAETACRLAVVAPEDFRRMAFAQPSVHRRVMRAGRAGDGRVTAIEQNRERLAALGTMAAGLAHELNNPAAAARRAAAQLTEALEAIGSALGSFVEAGSSARTPSGSWSCSARRSPTRRPPRRSTRSTPPMPRRSCSGAWRSSMSRSPGASPSRWRRRAWINGGSIVWRSSRGPRRAPRCAGSPPR